MILCSCNIISTDDIMKVISTGKNEKEILSIIGWKSNCGICSKNLVSEIRKLMETHNET